jgi:hypothetical protein
MRFVDTDHEHRNDMDVEPVTKSDFKKVSQAKAMPLLPR